VNGRLPSRANIAVRNTLFSSMRVALGPDSPACSSFFDAPDSVKTRVLLGAPSDDPNVDRRVDVAFRKFLIRVDTLRLRHILLPVTLSHIDSSFLTLFKKSASSLVTALTKVGSRHCVSHSANVLQHFGNVVHHHCSLFIGLCPVTLSFESSIEKASFTHSLKVTETMNLPFDLQLTSGASVHPSKC